MSNERYNHILEELSKPFHPSRITWRPGAMTGKKDKALALAYADTRAYQNRLDEVCGMDWAVSYTPWGERIICHLTINGITRSSTGEPDSDSERSEMAGTTSEAQAFKRACAMFGLGRYLYNLPSLWVEYDAANGRFTEKAKVRLQGMIAQHYQRFLDGQPPAAEESAEEPGEETTSEATAETKPAKQPTEQKPADPKRDALIGTLENLGVQLYGEQWAHVKAHNVRRLINEDGTVADLSIDQIQTLINGLKTLKKNRQL